MCYTRKEERDLDREARRITEKRLLEESSRREEEHARRRAEEQEEKPLTGQVKEMVGGRQRSKAPRTPPRVLRTGGISLPRGGEIGF